MFQLKYACLNKCVLRFFLKQFRVDDCLILSGRLFHSFGAATLKARSPYEVLDFLTVNRLLFDDRSDRAGV